MQQNNISPLFSVIIPTKNRCSLLMKALDSVLHQSYENFELIVVDDDSNDDTLAQVGLVNDSRVHLLKNIARERSAARNTGIAIAKGSYICFLDDDDMYEVNYLQDFYDQLAKLNFPTDTILRTGFYSHSDNDAKKYSELYDEKKHINTIRFAAYTMCGVWSLCVPKICLKEDVFDERFPHWQDTHLILRLLAKYKFYQMNSHNYCYRIHEAMGSKQIYNASQIKQKADVNVAAIIDFFENNEATVHQYLLEETLSFLIAEKYAQYAVRASKINKKSAFQLLKKSLSNGIYTSNFKHYFAFLKSLF